MEKQNQNKTDEKLAKLIKDNTKNGFDPFFAERVMSKVNSQIERRSPIDQVMEQLLFQFRKMALAALLILTFLISYNVIDEGELTFASVLDIPQVSLEDALDPINYLEWSE